MKLPGKVKVGPYDIAIRKFPASDANEQRIFSDFSADGLRIRITEDLTPAKAADSLLHEILHAVFWVWNIKSGDKEERTVNTVATALTTVFRDNPKVAKWILNQSKMGTFK